MKDAAQNPRSFLIPIDDSPASEKAVGYLAGLAGSLPPGSLSITLFHVLPMPPKLVEHGGEEDPREETRRERELAGERGAWAAEAEQAARPILDRAAATLRRANVSEGDIRREIVSDVHEDIAKETLAWARANRCGTIVVGRESFPWYRELTRTHVADDLVKSASDVAVCVVQ